MSAPRRLVAGTTHLVTRFCTQRRPLLRPGELTNEIFLYCLASAAARTGIQLHGVVQMPDHWSAVVTDPGGRLPAFLQLFHRLVATAMNVLLNRREHFWDCGPTSVLALESADAVLEALTELVARPVAAALVATPEQWPGLRMSRIGERRVAQRPKIYFRKNGGMPEWAAIDCTIPPMLRAVERKEAGRRLRARVAIAIRSATRAVRELGERWLGIEGVRAMPLSPSEPKRDAAREHTSTMAALEQALRLATWARDQAFQRAYQLAFGQWVGGDRQVMFPEGTYLMRVLHRARCEPLPAA